MRTISVVLVLVILVLCTAESSPDDKKPPGTEGRPKVVREEIEGPFYVPGSKATKITGKVKVIDAHTLRLNDGTELELNGGMDAPDLEQMGLIGESFYPCGKEAAEFLAKLIGDHEVTCFLHDRGGVKLHATCFVGEKCVDIELVRNGWALSHHSGMVPWEIIARENKRGLWRGKFVMPENWRKGERLRGERAAAQGDKPQDEHKAGENSKTEKPKVLKEQVRGKLRITGKAQVVDAHTIVFADGTEVDINGLMDAPDLEQKGLIGDSFYPCGKEAAEFLKKLIGDQTVTFKAFGSNDKKPFGMCYAGETLVQEVMVRNGWARADHSALELAELIARENKHGVWRGEFISPSKWRKGERLPGE